MPEPESTTAPEKPRSLICPHCRKDLNVSVVTSGVSTPQGIQFLAVLVFCTACLKPVPCTTLPTPTMQPHRSAGGLIIPGVN